MTPVEVVRLDVVLLVLASAGIVMSGGLVLEQRGRRVGFHLVVAGMVATAAGSLAVWRVSGNTVNLVLTGAMVAVAVAKLAFDAFVRHAVAQARERERLRAAVDSPDRRDSTGS